MRMFILLIRIPLCLRFFRICCYLIFLAGYNYLVWESGVVGRLHAYTLRKITTIFLKNFCMADFNVVEVLKLDLKGHKM
jgi:hypothetical protein